MIHFPTKVTLLANGLPSGTLTVDLSPDYIQMMVEIPSSGNWPFQSSAYTYRLWFKSLSLQNNFVHGFITLMNPWNAVIMDNVPFCIYVGDEWPQAPIGMVHSLKPFDVDGNQFVLFTVLFEKAAHIEKAE